MQNVAIYGWRILKLVIKRQDADCICNGEGGEKLHFLGNLVMYIGVQ